MKNLLTILSVCLITINSMGQAFQKTFGGAGGDIGNSVQQTADGGFIILGNTSSFGAGLNDVYLIRTDANGDTLWAKSFGETGEDFGNSVQQTADGGFIITGYTNSFGAIGYDVYLVKTDSTGVISWAKIYGGTGADLGNSVQQTFDGGYIITGYTNSFGVSGEDVYLIRTDANGDTLWTKTFGGAINDFGNSVRQTADSGYIIAGYTNSFGAGNRDVYLIRTDANGDTLWTRTFGGPGFDRGNSAQQTADGGYIVTGFTGLGAGSNDVYLIRTDANGDTLWTKAYGGTGAEEGYSVFQTADGGYVITGFTNSFGPGNDDVYLVRTNANGALLWSKTFGGTAAGDRGNSVQQTADGGYIIAGYTGFGTGGNDVYLIRTDVNGNSGGCHQGSPGTILTNPATQVNSSGPIIGAGATVNNVTTIVNTTATVVYDLNISLSIAGTDVSCTGGSDGSADLTVSGGIPFYSFLWTNGETTEDIAGIQAGTYAVTVVDANGCMAIGIITISELPGMTLSFFTADATCATACNGSAVVVPVDGTAPFTYQWNDSLLQTNDTAINLCAGNYSVTVTDSNGCIATGNSSVSALPGISLSFSSNAASCAASCDGSAVVTPSNGTAPYTYLWNNGQTDSIATGLCTGTDTITVTDANGCAQTGNVNISAAPPAISLSFFIVDVSVCNICDGFAAVTPSGGIVPYTYLWSDGQTTANATGLCMGSYSVTVTDSSGCTVTGNVTISPPYTIGISIGQDISDDCGLCEGTGLVNSVWNGTPPYTYLWSNGQTTTTATGLCYSETYSITVIDANGCTTSSNLNPFGGGSAISLSFFTADASCGACDGFAAVTASGGWSAYTYLWSNGQTTATATGLCVGTYTVTVTNGEGCTTTESVLISQQPVISLAFSSTSASCQGVCDGSAAVTPSGGAAPYTYLWSDGQTTAAATGLCAGTYTVTVTDDNGCFTEGTVSVTAPFVMSLSFSTTGALCTGVCDGFSLVTPSGGTAPYTYLWSDGQTTDIATGLCTGTHTVTVTDDNACTATESVLISPQSAVSLTFSAAGASCVGVCDGSAFVTPSGGTAPYTYLWSDGQITDTATSLCAGTYTVTVTDANGCIADSNVPVTAPSVISLSFFPADASCPGICDGSATATPSGGISPYTYLWSNGQTDTTATGLCSGTTTVIATDSNGCSIMDTVMINQPNNTIIDSIAINSNVSCNGGSDGGATITTLGLTFPYDYVWSSGGTTLGSMDSSNSETGLAAGTYSVTVTDANGCFEIATVTITEPLALTLTSYSSKATCGINDGTAWVVVAGGAFPYSYLWDDSLSQTTGTAVNLYSGIYTVVVTDANGCIDSSIATVSELGGPAINVDSIQNISCNGGSDGAIYITASGSTPPYNYSWSNGDTIEDIGNLSAGTYIVTVTDSGGCVSIKSINITEPVMILTMTIDSIIRCNGGTGGVVTANLTGAIPPYNYIWSTGDSTIGSSLPTDTITGLSAGIYTVTATDLNGCAAFNTLTLTEPDTIILTVTVDSNVSCNGGADGIVTANLTGGILPYNYSWSTGENTIGTALLTNTISDLSTGIYIVTISDINGCTTIDSVTVTEPDTIILTATVDSNVSCNGGADGMATINLTGGIPPYNYVWSSGSSTLGSTDTINTETGLSAGTYSITVTDANGCFAVDSVTITEPSALSLTIDESFANCGLNDGMAWVVVNGGTAPYSYLWNDAFSQTTDTAFNLYPGIYTVLVTDANGCIETETTIVNNLGGPIIAVDSISNITCNGGSDGSISITVSGGTLPYIYLWSSSDTVEDINNLAAGTYIVNVTDSNNCQTFNFININEPPAIILLTTADSNVTCNGGSDATATVTIISGGIAPYDYIWSSGGSTLSSTDTINSEIGLPAGTYTISVTDANGCTAIDSVTITEPLLAPTNVAATICDGDSTLLGGVYQTTAGNYNDTLLSVNGCDSVIITTLTINPLPTVNLGPDMIICNGCSITLDAGAGFINYAWSTGVNTQTITVDSAGTYIVQVTDADSCVGEDTIVIDIASGVGELSNNENINIYPNPNTGRFTLKMDLKKSARLSINIYQIYGQLIYTREFPNITGNYIQQIDLSKYSKGIYYLQIVSERGVITKKVIYQ